MLRRLLLLSMSLTLCWATLACGDPTLSNSYQNPPARETAARMQTSTPPLAAGQYPVQQATYNDGDGEYTVVLLNTQPGQPSVFRTANLPMARLTEAEVAAGQKSYLKVENNQPSLHLTEDFKIEYIHNVTETRPNPETGQPQTVVVRQEPSFWTPFAGALAGQALGSLLFRPQYYMPPVYQPGLPLSGFGSYGRTYGQAVDRYQSRYQTAPPAIRNRQAFRTSDRLRTNQPTLRRNPSTYNRDRSTGYGYGSSNLRRSNRQVQPRRSTGGFGSSRRSFSGGRRR